MLHQQDLERRHLSSVCESVAETPPRPWPGRLNISVAHIPCMLNRRNNELCRRDEFLSVCSLAGEALSARECKGPYDFQFVTSASTPGSGVACDGKFVFGL